MQCAAVVEGMVPLRRELPPSRYPRIEMVYDPECPNVERARIAIRGALTAIGAPLAWREWDCSDVGTPDGLRAIGSPSVLVNGHDVGYGAGSVAQADANACRIYRDDCGCICGAPSVELILEAIATSDAARAAEEMA
jgi:mercuric ion transport protein